MPEQPADDPVVRAYSILGVVTEVVHRFSLDTGVVVHPHHLALPGRLVYLGGTAGLALKQSPSCLSGLHLVLNRQAPSPQHGAPMQRTFINA